MKEFKKYQTQSSRLFKPNFYLPQRGSNNLFYDIFNEDDTEHNFHLFKEAVTKPPQYRNFNDLQIIIYFLKNTQLMEKFRGERLNELAYQTIMLNCATHLQIQLLKKGEILFKIDSIGEKFYLIIKGKVEVLKPIEKNRKMTLFEYFNHIKDLRNCDELHILQKTIKANYEYFPLQNVNQIDYIDKLIFKAQFLNRMEHFKIPIDVENFFLAHHKNPKDFKINLKNLKKLHKMNNREYYVLEPGLDENLSDDSFKKPYGDQLWIVYLNYKIQISKEEREEYQKFRGIERRNKKLDMFIYEYEIFMCINEGNYFGDFALDKKNKKRTATIRADEDLVLGVICHEIYRDYIFSEKQKIKQREVAFINENFLFKEIKIFSFETKFFQHFALNEYFKEKEIYKQNSIDNKIFLIREGKLEISFEGSIVDLHDCIKKIIEKYEFLINNINKIAHPFFSIKNANFISPKSLNLYLEDEHLIDINRLKFRCERIYDYVTKKRKIHLFILSVNEIVGLEDFFLDTKMHLYNADILSDRITVYKIDYENLKNIYKDEIKIQQNFQDVCLDKILFFIKRIYSVKKNFYEIFSQTIDPSYELFSKNKQKDEKLKISKEKEKFSLNNFSNFNIVKDSSEKMKILPYTTKSRKNVLSSKKNLIHIEQNFLPTNLMLSTFYKNNSSSKNNFTTEENNNKNINNKRSSISRQSRIYLKKNMNIRNSKINNFSNNDIDDSKENLEQTQEGKAITGFNLALKKIPLIQLYSRNRKQIFQSNEDSFIKKLKTTTKGFYSFISYNENAKKIDKEINPDTRFSLINLNNDEFEKKMQMNQMNHLNEKTNQNYNGNTIISNNNKIIITEYETVPTQSTQHDLSSTVRVYKPKKYFDKNKIKKMASRIDNIKKSSNFLLSSNRSRNVVETNNDLFFKTTFNVIDLSKEITPHYDQYEMEKRIKKQPKLYRTYDKYRNDK